MKVAFVSLYEAYPPASGAAYVTYHCARRMGCETLLVQLSKESGTERLGRLTVVSLALDSDARLAKLGRMPRLAEEMSEEVARFKPDHVVIEGASWAAYLLLVMRALRRKVPEATVHYHAHNVEYTLRRQRGNRAVALITRMAERRVLRGADECYAVSETDRAEFESLYGISPRLLPNGVDCENRTSVETARQARKRYRIGDGGILFMGLYAYPPNSEAVQFLKEEVMPRVMSAAPEAQLVVTGGELPFSAPWLVNPGVVSREELNGILKACRIGLAPIFSGSGTRLKILEYMASELPVVTTAKGAEGLKLRAEEHALYAEDGEQFAHAIVRLLIDEESCGRMSRAALEFVRRNYEWGVILGGFAAGLERGGRENDQVSRRAARG